MGSIPKRVDTLLIQCPDGVASCHASKECSPAACDRKKQLWLSGSSCLSMCGFPRRVAVCAEDIPLPRAESVWEGACGL